VNVLSVSVELQVSRPDVGEPADRLEGDRARVSGDYQPAQVAGGPVNEGLPAVVADAVADPEPTPPDPDVDREKLAMRRVLGRGADRQIYSSDARQRRRLTPVARGISKN
jgi:hypothetical protein